MKYILFDEWGTDIYTQEFETAQEAIEAGDSEFNHMSDRDRKNCKGFYVLESVNPDENAVNHHDGNYVKRWI